MIEKVFNLSDRNKTMSVGHHEGTTGGQGATWLAPSTVSAMVTMAQSNPVETRSGQSVVPFHYQPAPSIGWVHFFKRNIPRRRCIITSWSNCRGKHRSMGSNASISTIGTKNPEPCRLWEPAHFHDHSMTYSPEFASACNLLLESDLQYRFNRRSSASAVFARHSTSGGPGRPVYRTRAGTGGGTIDCLNSAVSPAERNAVQGSTDFVQHLGT